MFALSLSGIDLKSLSFSAFHQDDESKLEILIALDANKLDYIILIDSNIPLNLHKYKNYLEKSKIEVKEIYKRFKKFLAKKLI